MPFYTEFSLQDRQEERRGCSLLPLTQSPMLGKDLKLGKLPPPIFAPHLIVEYAGMFPGHVVTVTIVCKAHIHVSSCKVAGVKEKVENRL